MKHAIAKFVVKNGVQGFELIFPGPHSGDEENTDLIYGHYPCDENRFEESMTAAVADALEYGFDGILFHGSWKAK